VFSDAARCGFFSCDFPVFLVGYGFATSNRESSMHRAQFTIGSIAAAMLVATASHAGADIISGNLSAGVSSGSGTFMGLSSTTIYKTVGWTMPGQAYTLEKATLSMDYTQGGQVLVSIWMGANFPTTQVATLETPVQSGVGDFDFTPTSPLNMEAGETYWLYVTSVPNPTGSLYWQGTTPTTVPTGVAAHVGYIFNGNPSTARNRFEIVGSPASQCYANCDGSTTPPILNVEDFSCFINEFAAAQNLPHQQQLTHYANCDQSTTPPVLNVEDFSCFINKFATGCP
jgi:hypothetical protein